ncbi:sensor histidine kinase [Kribbella sp. NPDC056345]|uniref:sensor histidine kinase n=1 Tax=Kribbella sp. NPDC056345 TaxID=3345789 RepID=UPI0035DDD6D9
MKDLWTERRALWVDAAIAAAALVSLRFNAADVGTGGWLWGRLLLVLLPLLIAVRRIEPAVALPGLVIGVYLANGLGQPPWILYGGIVLALWSLAGRCKLPTVIAATLLSAAIPLVLEWLRAAAFSYDIDSAPYATWWWQLSGAMMLTALVCYVVRYRSWAQAVSVLQRWRDLWAFLRNPDYELIRDVLLGATFASLILTEVGSDLAHGAWWSAPAWMPYGVGIAGLTLTLRRWPLIPAVVLAVASLIANWQSYQAPISLYVAFGLALYWLVAKPKRSRSLRWTLPVAIGLLTLLPLITRQMRVRYLQLIFPQIKERGWDNTFDGVLRNSTYDGIVQNVWPYTLSLILLVAVLAAIAMRQYQRNREAARREAELEQAAEELEAEQVVLTERAIIARDLHDVVAHAVNLMVIQAETGPDLVRRGEADVLAGFQRIGDAGRRALSELDRLLSTLRDEDGIADPQLAPQPGLSDLSQLVADVADDRLPIELDLQGDLETPPEGQQVTAYRLVQEALTNVVKHAKATGVRVAVRSEETGVRVEVTDDGVGFDVAAARRGNRHGLAGMRERVRIEGGTLDIRSTPGSGTTVDAWMPVGGRR